MLKPVYNPSQTANPLIRHVSVMGEVVRWSKVDQTERYTVQHPTITEGVVDTVLHHDNNTLLLLDSLHHVWLSDNSSLTQLNPASALGG